MAFKRVTEKFDTLAGFWNREGILQGFLMGPKIQREIQVGKKKETRGFYVLKLTEACSGTVKDSDEIVTFPKGKAIGVSASAVLEKSFDSVKDKVEVKITSNGKKPLADGHSVWDFDVEIDEDSVYKPSKDDDTIPF